MEKLSFDSQNFLNHKELQHSKINTEKEAGRTEVTVDLEESKLKKNQAQRKISVQSQIETVGKPTLEFFPI